MVKKYLRPRGEERPGQMVRVARRRGARPRKALGLRYESLTGPITGGETSLSFLLLIVLVSIE